MRQFRYLYECFFRFGVDGDVVDTDLRRNNIQSLLVDVFVAIFCYDHPSQTVLIVELAIRLDFYQDGCQYLPDVEILFFGRLVGCCCKVLCSLCNDQREVFWSERHCCFLVFVLKSSSYVEEHHFWVVTLLAA